MDTVSPLQLFAALTLGYLVALPLYALAGLASLQYFYYAYESTPEQRERFVAGLRFPFSLYRAPYWHQMYEVFVTARTWYVARTVLLLMIFWTSVGWAILTIAQPNVPLANALVAGAFVVLYLISAVVILRFGRNLVWA